MVGQKFGCWRYILRGENKKIDWTFWWKRKNWHLKPQNWFGWDAKSLCTFLVFQNQMTRSQLTTQINCRIAESIFRKKIKYLISRKKLHGPKLLSLFTISRWNIYFLWNSTSIPKSNKFFSELFFNCNSCPRKNLSFLRKQKLPNCLQDQWGTSLRITEIFWPHRLTFRYQKLLFQGFQSEIIQCRHPWTDKLCQHEPLSSIEKSRFWHCLEKFLCYYPKFVQE